MSDSGYEIPNDDDVSPDDIHPDVDLSEADLAEADLPEANLKRADLLEASLINADLSEADLAEADLSGAVLAFTDLSEADLRGADLSGATLREAELSEAFLGNADLSGATLCGTDLSGAVLAFTDLSEADLRGADLSEAGLRGADLSRANLRGAELVGLSANQRTRVGKMCPVPSDPDEYDNLAQAYHELKEALSDEGLSQLGRRARTLEQQARTAEAWERFKTQFADRVQQLRTLEGWRQWFSPPWPASEVRTQFWRAVGGIFSRWLTGYGTRPSYILLWTVCIIVGTTVLFALGPRPADGWEGGPLYYSVVTFVTSPPHPPRGAGIVIRAVVLSETYFSTALTVLLGYVLGTRERI